MLCLGPSPAIVTATRHQSVIAGTTNYRTHTLARAHLFFLGKTQTQTLRNGQMIIKITLSRRAHLRLGKRKSAASQRAIIAASHSCIVAFLSV